MLIFKTRKASKLPGHPWVLQLCTSVDFPAQSRPPLLGGGFVHDRRRPWTPPPHDWEQSPHSAQADQSPWTDIKESRCHYAHVAENLRVMVKTKGLLLNYSLRIKPIGEMGDHVRGLRTPIHALGFIYRWSLGPCRSRIDIKGAILRMKSSVSQVSIVINPR